jgi:hypothetical protein
MNASEYYFWNGLGKCVKYGVPFPGDGHYAIK